MFFLLSASYWTIYKWPCVCAVTRVRIQDWGSDDDDANNSENATLSTATVANIKLSGMGVNFITSVTRARFEVLNADQFCGILKPRTMKI